MVRRDEAEALLSTFADRPPPFRDDAALLHDIGLGGDDASEFLQALSARFGTDFSAMTFHDHFPNETDHVIYHWGRILGLHALARRLGVFRDPYVRVTFGHLLAVLDRGVWFDPDEAQPNRAR